VDSEEILSVILEDGFIDIHTFQISFHPNLVPRFEIETIIYKILLRYSNKLVVKNKNKKTLQYISDSVIPHSVLDIVIHVLHPWTFDFLCLRNELSHSTYAGSTINEGAVRCLEQCEG